MRRNITIGVTGLNSTDSPAPGIPVIRCIKEGSAGRVQGIGLGYDSLDAGLYKMGYFKHVYLLPYPSEGADCLLQRLLKIHEKTAMDMIIPTLDSEIYNFINIEDKIHRSGITTFIPTKEQLSMCSKTNIGGLEKDADILVPAGRVIKEVDKAGKAAEELGFPIMVKGIFYEAYKAHNMDEVNKFILKISDRWGMPIILQKYMEGDEFNVTAVGDGKGGMVGMVCMRKLLTTDKGKGWAGVTIRDDELDRIAGRFFDATEWRGPVELEILKKKRTDKFYLLEVNPRFPAWVYLSKAAGVNLPWLLVRLALGEGIKKANKDYKIGVIFTRYTDENILNIKQLETLNVEGELHYE
ncbi:MAG: ATP-grasp domain-containing protein [Nitrospinae bacterium]|nr:ATP-grasp domain-containing protein [Nitrospinota bacterium]